MEPAFTIHGRIWIETGGEKVLGPGRIELLERIQASGSIRQAALQMEMSYKQAWDLIKHMNTYLNFPVVISHRGGKGGGKAVVTENGINLIMQYHQLQKKFRQFLTESSINIDL